MKTHPPFIVAERRNGASVAHNAFIVLDGEAGFVQRIREQQALQRSSSDGDGDGVQTVADAIAWLNERHAQETTIITEQEFRNTEGWASRVVECAELLGWTDIPAFDLPLAVEHDGQAALNPGEDSVFLVDRNGQRIAGVNPDLPNAAALAAQVAQAVNSYDKLVRALRLLLQDVENGCDFGLPFTHPDNNFHQSVMAARAALGEPSGAAT